MRSPISFADHLSKSIEKAFSWCIVIFVMVLMYWFSGIALCLQETLSLNRK